MGIKCNSYSIVLVELGFVKVLPGMMWFQSSYTLERSYLYRVETVLILLIAAAFIGMLAVNVFFRARVLKAYKHLQRAGVEFDGRDMLSKSKIESLVQRFPDSEDDIRKFTGGIRTSMSLASGLIVLITLLGAVLMWYR